MRRYAETLRLIERFEAQQIPTLSLKGSVLSQVLYGDISMRISGDIDLLISPASLEKAEEILLQEGYVQQETQGEMTERQRALLLKTQHHFGYWNAEKKLFVELHWRLLAATYCFHFDELWAQRTRLNLHGRQLHVLSTEENLLTLASHGAKHAWYRLKWLCDIQAILQMEGLCQRYIVRQAWQRGIEPMLAQAFILCHQLFHTELHADWFAPEAFLRAQRLAQLALVFILSPDVWINSPDRIWRFRNKAYMLLLNRGSTRKLSFFISSLYPIGEDFRQIRIGDRYFALYYVLRPIFIIKRFLHIDRKRDAKQ